MGAKFHDAKGNVIDAIRFWSHSASQCMAFIGEPINPLELAEFHAAKPDGLSAFIRLKCCDDRFGKYVQEGDWLARDAKGSLFRVEQGAFALTYSRVDPAEVSKEIGSLLAQVAEAPRKPPGLTTPYPAVREIVTHHATSEDTAVRVYARDAAGAGGANLQYSITFPGCMMLGGIPILFQEGPVTAYGINGCTNESLLAIVADRLECFQAGSFKCRENAIALDAVKVAMESLKNRTRDRLARGVEVESKA